MKNILCAALFALAACSPTHKPNPSPTDPNVCTPTTCPDCPVAPECPSPTVCPDCPDCPPPAPPPVCPEPPSPPAPPTYEDVEHSVTDFEITAVLAAKDTLGFYVADPNGDFDASVFVMPELNQKAEYVDVLVLTDDAGKSTSIGVTEGRYDQSNLVAVVICDREFGPACTGKVITNGPNISKLKIYVNDSEHEFAWDKK